MFNCTGCGLEKKFVYEDDYNNIHLCEDCYDKKWETEHSDHEEFFTNNAKAVIRASQQLELFHTVFTIVIILVLVVFLGYLIYLGIESAAKDGLHFIWQR